MELRLIIPASPVPGHYQIKTAYPALPNPRHRSKEIVSSISKPEYQTVPYDRLEITIRERTSSSRKHRHHQPQGISLAASKSTPNLGRSPECIPRPPPPPPLQLIQSERCRQHPSPYANSDASKVRSAINPPWSNRSSSVSKISPLAPGKDQLFVLPPFQEHGSGLAIEFGPMETGAPPLGQHDGSPLGPNPRLSSHTMVYELEDTSKGRLQSPVNQLSPVSLLEKPLPLLPLEKKMHRAESYPPLSKLRKQNPSSQEFDPRCLSFRSDRKLSMTGYGTSQACLHKSSAQSTHPTVSRTRESRPTTGHSKISFRQLQPDSQTFHPQHQMERKQSRNKKKQQKPFEIHLGKLHLVIGSTRQELTDSKRNASRYSDFEASKPHYQDSRGQIQHIQKLHGKDGFF
ncbi:hypothetical protein TWF730_000898 [Orbilia blumenaviensis]|uniref:Uncharacterized protein n=1 Tax=Orbilia blumenaviensis TaxID=1796055 RepID=A0AAV9VMY9_9PEZI